MFLRYFKQDVEPAHFSALRDVPLFSGLSTHEMHTLDDLLHHRHYVAQEIVIDQEEEGQAIYFILSGKVQISRRDSAGFIAELEAGQFFGERALLEDAPRAAQARATENCVLAVLFREDFLGLLQTHPQIAEKITAHCSLRDAKQPIQPKPAQPILLSYLRDIPGPVTWIGIIAVTCLTLFLFKKILWLGVPFILALILYYLLAPMAKRMVLSGFSNDFAAVTLCSAFLLVTSLLIVMFYPLAIANGNQWQTGFVHYLSGGAVLMDHLLKAMQERFSVLQSMQFGNDIYQQFRDFSDHFSDKYLGNIAFDVAAWLPSLILTPVITFFLLKDGAYLRKMLGGAVPNAFFEKTLYLMHAVDKTAKMYFIGLMKLTLVDMVLVSAGLWAIGLSTPLLWGMLIAIFCWIPYLGPLLGLAMMMMVAATDFPGNMTMVYSIMALFLCMRALDDFIFLPLILGRSLHIHPLLTVVMFLIGDAIAGVAGLMLVIPLLAVVMVLGETLEIILTDTRLQARHQFARRLIWRAANHDLK